MSTETVRPLRQDAARNRRHLVDAARRIFGHDGLESCVEAVAREAGVGTGTLYRHFPSKEDLIAALVDNLSQEVLAAAQTALTRDDGSGLWEFLRVTGELQAENQGLLARLWRDGHRPARVTAVREAITALVADAHAHGTLPPRVGQPDVLLVLHGLRGVIESAPADGAAWQRYLDIATAGLTA